MFSKPADSLERIHPRSIKFLIAPVNRLLRARLWLQVLIALVLGIALGLLLNPEAGFVSEPTALTVGEWLALPGNLFLAFIQMIVIPLILASIIRGIAAATDMRQLRTTGIGLAAYFVLTAAVAVVLGITIGLTLEPGGYVDRAGGETEVLALPEEAELALEGTGKQEQGSGSALQEVPQRITSVLPTNPMSSIVRGDMLQIVIFSIVIGIALLSLPVTSAKPVLELLGSLQQICMAIVGVVMTFAPLAAFGLLAQAMIKAGASVLAGLGAYAVVVVFGMFVLLVVYLLIAMIFGGRNPFVFLKAIREPLLLAFSTDSSAATMPVTVKAAEEGLGVRPSLSQFIVPLGATVNMGGTALYQGLATIFMAQLFDVEISMGVLVALVITAVGASIGTPAVPGVGIIVLASVLSSVGIPLTGLALIIGLDRFLERFRASLNVAGDLVACVVMDRMVPATVSRKEELAAAKEIESAQVAGAEDVIVGPGR